MEAENSLALDKTLNITCCIDNSTLRDATIHTPIVSENALRNFLPASFLAIFFLTFKPDKTKKLNS
jgi:hypothetical protein